MTWETVDATAGGSPDIARDRWGRPMVVPPNGGKPVAYTRVTTFVAALEDQHNLMAWKQRQTVAGVCQRKDLHLRAASLGLCPEDERGAAAWKARMDEVCEQAMEASGSSSKATIGTALHTFTEAVDQGQDVIVPAEFAGHVENYRRATAPLRPVAIEQFLVCDEFKVAGTADRVLQVAGEDGLIIGDLKTGRVDYPHKMAMQLAVYAHSLRYDPATGGRAPVEGIRLDKGLIIALDAATGSCELLWIDLAAGWEAVTLAAKVRAWRARRGLTAPADLGGPAPAPARPGASRDKAADRRLLETAATPGELEVIAGRLKEAGAWDANLNTIAKNRWAVLTGQAPF